MKSLYKILILVCTFLVAAGALLLFVKTIVTPPVASMPANLHTNSIRSDIGRLDSQESEAFNEAMFYQISDKIALFADESFIDSDMKDKLTDKFISSYVPVFKTFCERRFNTPGWDDANFASWRSIISDILNSKSSSGQEIVQQADRAELSRILGVMNDYNNAKNIALSTSFTSMAGARANIVYANDYYHRPYIANSKYGSTLANYKTSIEAAHYQYLVSIVEQLQNYQYMDRDSYFAKRDIVSDSLDEYRNNADDVYGADARDISSLYSTASGYQRSAYEFFSAGYNNYAY